MCTGRKQGHIGEIPFRNRLILGAMGGMLRPSIRLTYRHLGAAMTCVGVIDARAVAAADSDELINILGRREVTAEEEAPSCGTPCASSWGRP